MTGSSERRGPGLGGIVLAEEPLDAILEIICYDARAEIPHAQDVTVTVVDRKGFRTAAATSDVVRDVDAVQYDLDEGPCVAASEEHQTFEVESMQREERWPRYTPHAVEAGIGSSISMPLYGGEGTSGAINVYSYSEGAFDDEDRLVAGEFARRAAVVLVNASAFAAQRELAEQLREAIATREVVGKAIGILMEREGIDDDAAFAMLRTASQNGNVKLRDIAEELVRRARPARGS
ncbi:MAG: GAF and ANTAR domain-containing protein [Actinomycetota bacterium]|nr:GAF and ANTAR domain-containing protein [Actinomycetota bacterium]